MNIKALLVVFYIAASIVTFGHASNNDRVPDGGAVFASTLWPFYVSHELWRIDD